MKMNLNTLRRISRYGILAAFSFHYGIGVGIFAQRPKLIGEDLAVWFIILLLILWWQLKKQGYKSKKIKVIILPLYIISILGMLAGAYAHGSLSRILLFVALGLVGFIPYVYERIKSERQKRLMS